MAAPRPARGASRWAAAALLIVVSFAGLAPRALADPGPIGQNAGFEDDDGHLAPNPAGINFDWNSFKPVTWKGTAPYQTATASLGPTAWQFTGLTDAQKSNSDTQIASGTKQDEECPRVNTGSAQNKTDLERIYVAHKSVGGHLFLELAWIRIPQNNTSANADAAFESNQGSSPCPSGSDSVVHRSVGDILILYDFPGGSAEPILIVRPRTTSGRGAADAGFPPPHSGRHANRAPLWRTA
jgi:hypothetical protein